MKAKSTYVLYLCSETFSNVRRNFLEYFSLTDFCVTEFQSANHMEITS